MKRRRHPRFVLTQAWTGELNICDDVAIEGVDGDRIWIGSRAGVRPEDRLSLVVFAAPGLITMQVRALECQPVVRLGTLSYRVSLEVLGAGLDQLHQVPRATAPAALWRATDVEILELARGGCLASSRTALAPGAVGVLRVSSPRGSAFADGARVASCRLREGAAIYRVGVELLPTLREVSATGEASLREIVSGPDPARGA